MVGISLINICQRGKKNKKHLHTKKDIVAHLLLENQLNVSLLSILQWLQTRAGGEPVRNTALIRSLVQQIHQFIPEVLPVSPESFTSPSSEFTLATEPIIVESLERKEKNQKQLTKKGKENVKRKRLPLLVVYVCRYSTFLHHTFACFHLLYSVVQNIIVILVCPYAVKGDAKVIKTLTLAR